MSSRPLLALAAALLALALALLLWSRAPKGGGPAASVAGPPSTPAKPGGGVVPRHAPREGVAEAPQAPAEVAPDPTDAARPRGAARAAAWGFASGGGSRGRVGYRGLLLDADGRPLARAEVAVERTAKLSPLPTSSGSTRSFPPTPFPLPPVRVTTDEGGGVGVLGQRCAGEDAQLGAGDGNAILVHHAHFEGRGLGRVSTRLALLGGGAPLLPLHGASRRELGGLPLR